MYLARTMAFWGNFSLPHQLCNARAQLPLGEFSLRVIGINRFIFRLVFRVRFAINQRCILGKIGVWHAGQKHHCGN